MKSVATAQSDFARPRRFGKSPKEMFREALAWYDSYRFSPYSKVRVINPVALGKAFETL